MKIKDEHLEQLEKEVQHIFDSGVNEIRVYNMIQAFIEKRGKALFIDSVIPMLPKMKSNEFENYLKSSGYERIDDELLQKGTDYYCVNNVYRHFLNLIEFGN